MIIDAVSDLHGHFPKLEGGDLLIVAGDCTSDDSMPFWNQYFNWLDQQDYRKKIMIAGNHDNFCKEWALSNDSIYEALIDNPSITYLCDSGTEFEGLKIFGSPWTKTFPRMNPKCKAFTVDTEEELAEKWKLIPANTDILITHSPPFGILDIIEPDWINQHEGSISLMDRINHVLPLVHVFGHIHEAYGEKYLTPTNYINASHVNERYHPVNKPIRIIL